MVRHTPKADELLEYVYFVVLALKELMLTTKKDTGYRSFYKETAN